VNSFSACVSHSSACVFSPWETFSWFGESKDFKGGAVAVGDTQGDVKKMRQTAYLTRQIIPYIGNKRKLLPLIHQALQHVFPEGFGEKRFLDPFAGSGVVSRFAKYLGFEVYSNDWELYSYLSCYAYLTLNPVDLDTMYAAWDGVDGILKHMNSLPAPSPQNEFIARYYSPRDDAKADYRKERLFYTRENGLIIDRIRSEIERLYPFPMAPHVPRKARSAPHGEDGWADRTAYSEKALLLALLIHAAATHTNTSGVFKAFHKGFGGFSGDALNRILKPIVLTPPPLWDSPYPQHVFRMDAAELLRRLSGCEFDVAYLDPPYNQHQYGSNYHMLNTIALWDLLSPGDRETGGKAGIRRDWVLTRSDYCYRDSAVRAFSSLLKELRARYIFVSYSTEGIIPFDMLIDICTRSGKVSLFTDEYVKYRGGRQSIHRLNHNVEFVILIDTSRRTVQSDLDAIDGRLLERQLNLQSRRMYVRSRIKDHFLVHEESEAVGFEAYGVTTWIDTHGFVLLKHGDLSDSMNRLPFQEGRRRKAKEKLLSALRQCQCRDRLEELQQLLLVLEESRDDAAVFTAPIPGLLRKIAHKKYRKAFFDSLGAIRELQRKHPHLFQRIAQKVDDVELLAKKRFVE
jgi:adenine-specific DNA-methyltransferase